MTKRRPTTDLTLQPARRTCAHGRGGHCLPAATGAGAQVGRLRDRRARDDPQLSIHSPRSHAVWPRHAWQCHLAKRARAQSPEPRANGRGPRRLTVRPTWGARSVAAWGR